MPLRADLTVTRFARTITVMRGHRSRRGSLAGVMLCLVTAMATRLDGFVLGGGNADKDCRVAFGGVNSTDGDSGVVCTDGDPACDVDGVADGTCRFAPSLCTGVAVEGCTPIVIESLDVAGLPLAPPLLPSGAGACGPTLDVGVAVGDAVGATAIGRSGGALRDVDYLNLCCRAAAAPFDAARCALAVDPTIAGCAGRLPAAVGRKFGRARAAIQRAAADPGRAGREVRRASRALDRVKRIAQRLAATEPCGDALALVVSHALTTIEAGRLRAGVSPTNPSDR